MLLYWSNLIRFFRPGGICGGGGPETIYLGKSPPAGGERDIIELCTGKIWKIPPFWGGRKQFNLGKSYHTGKIPPHRALPLLLITTT